MTNKNTHLLIVDDEEAHVEAIRRAFDEAGAHVTIESVGTLREFQACVQARRPDLALIDLNLPDGRAVEALHQPPEDAPFPVLVMTAFGNQQIVVEVMKAGALDYVVKSPAAFALMPRTVEQALREWGLLQKHKQAEAALRESEERFRSLLQGVPTVAVQGYAPDGTTRYWNQASERLYGYTAQEAIGRNLLDLIVPPEMREFVKQAVQQIAQTGQPTPAVELSLMRKDGSRVPVFSSHAIVQIPGREPELFCIDVDLTERKRAEEVLRSYHILVENIPDWVWEVDAQGLYTYASPAVRNILGYTPEEVVGRKPYDFMPAEEARRVGAIFAELAAKHRAFVAVENVNRHSDGHLVVLETSGNPIFGNTGEFLGYRGIDRDISARKQAEESQARLATAVAQAAETIVITDIKGTILYANPAFAKVTGYTCEEALGKNPRMLRSGKHSTEFYRQLWATLTAGQVWSGHLINKRKDGTLIEEEATISPVFDAAGAIVNYVAVKRDVTREVALEAQTRQAAKMEAVGQLAGGVAHDFNNQLQVILGCTEVILGNLPPDHAFRDDLQEIRKAARHSADLTRQLLAFSRKQMIAPVVLDVSAAISGSLKMLSRLIGENIRLNFTLAQDTGAVFMDPSQWDQILANLAVNARDAIAGTGNIFIEAAPRTLAEADCRDKTDFVTPGDYVVLTFRDDGPGMTPEIQGHIFEPFFTTKGVGKGTGMGLATVYGIIKQNHGAISVQSAPGQGATFSIYLPRATAAAVAATEKMAERIPTGTETILLVEDETSVLSLIQRTLARQGYNILPAATPAEALRVCRSHPAPIDMLLTDVIMPEMGGRDLAERIQKLRPGIRVIFMSGYTTDIMEQQGHLPAGLHVMQKPFTGAVLAQRIRAMFDAPPTPPPAA
jgi:PAS domain S-box-containing protein